MRPASVQHAHVPRGQMAPQIQHGLGSGVIVTKDGYIMTNNHVVDGAKEVKVTLQDGREFTAKVVGRDPKSDIAVVKVDANDLPTVSIADSEKVEVGDVVLAIGNPFGVGQTVTSGIVSAKNNRDFAMATRSAVDARGYDVTRKVNRSLASRAPRRAVTSTTYSPVARLASGRSIA